MSTIWMMVSAVWRSWHRQKVGNKAKRSLVKYLKIQRAIF
jgi:hypothetical protein